MPNEELNAGRADARGDVDRSTPDSGGTGSRGSRPGGPSSGGQQPGGGGGNAGRGIWHFVAYIIVALIALYLFQQNLIGPMVSPSTELDYNVFKTKVAEGQILTAVIGDSQITGTMKNTDPNVTTPLEFKTNVHSGADDQLVPELQAAGVE